MVAPSPTLMKRFWVTGISLAVCGGLLITVLWQQQGSEENHYLHYTGPIEPDIVFKPKKVVKVLLKGGEEKSMEVGDRTPLGRHVYVRFDGKPAIYLVRVADLPLEGVSPESVPIPQPE